MILSLDRWIDTMDDALAVFDPPASTKITAPALAERQALASSVFTFVVEHDWDQTPVLPLDIVIDVCENV